MVSLQDLQLEAARALVGAGQLPADAEPARYLQALIDGLCELSLKDPLTGLSNRRQLFTVIDCELDRVARSGEAALLLMLDIDHFKHINDAHGHVAGDQVLQAVSRVLADSVRPMDTLVRFGGEEFAIVLPACHAAFGKSVAERIRRAVEAVRVPISALDRTVQRQVVELLRSLQSKYNLTYLFISHDLAVVRALSHQLMVVKQGQVIEQGPAEQIFAAPQQTYTRQLLEAAFMAPASAD